MPTFVETVVVPAAVEAVFAFFRVPANMLLLTPPELHLELVAAPPLLELGSRMEWKGRRWGMTQRTTLEVTALAMGKLLIEEQRSGPFRQWQHAYRFEAVAEQTTQLLDEVTFEPPGGLLGQVVTTTMVLRELTAFFHHRNRRLLEEMAGRITSPPA